MFTVDFRRKGEKMKHGDFTEMAKHYHNRPGYNPLMIEKLLACINDKALPKTQLNIAEVGAGTGKLTELLARDFKLNVNAIEPNDAMRHEGMNALKDLPNINWQKGSGEATHLPDQSQDWVVMASSFHWTDPQKSLPEFARILKGGSNNSEGGGGLSHRSLQPARFKRRVGVL